MINWLANTQAEYYLYLSKLGDKNGLCIFAIDRKVYVF